MKEKLVILHGWRPDLDGYYKIVDLLKDEFDVYFFPLPGFGEKLSRPYTLDDYLKFLENKLQDLENFYLLGHSFGGALAMLYAIKYPTKVKTLILYNAAIFRKRKLKHKIIYLITRILKPLEKILPQKLNFIIKKIFYRFLVKSYDYFLVDDNLKQTLINIAKDLTNDAKNVKTKTILLWGEKDRVTPLDDALVLKNLIKNSELITFDGGHSFHKTNPQKFIEILKTIIKHAEAR
jgi:pimeloyl-ACP methyl ester carboxylesterase